MYEFDNLVKNWLSHDFICLKCWRLLGVVWWRIMLPDLGSCLDIKCGERRIMLPKLGSCCLDIKCGERRTLLHVVGVWLEICLGWMGGVWLETCLGWMGVCWDLIKGSHVRWWIKCGPCWIKCGPFWWCGSLLMWWNSRCGRVCRLHRFWFSYTREEKPPERSAEK